MKTKIRSKLNIMLTITESKAENIFLNVKIL